MYIKRLINAKTIKYISSMSQGDHYFEMFLSLREDTETIILCKNSPEILYNNDMPKNDQESQRFDQKLGLSYSIELGFAN